MDTCTRVEILSMYCHIAVAPPQLVQQSLWMDSPTVA